MDEVRIQIVNYKTKQYLLECLSSIGKDLERGELTCNIGILDNASGDDLSDIPGLFPELRIEIIMNGENNGFGAGHNILAKEKSVHYLLLLNPDVKFIEPNTISRMLTGIKNFPAQVLGPRLVAPSGGTQKWDHGELRGIFAWATSLLGKSYWKELKKSSRVAWVSGAAFLIEKEWFDRLGGFDEKFFLYKEEEDLCLRLREQGGVVVYNPTISVFHRGSVVGMKSDYMGRSYAYFMKKHFGRKD